MFIWTKMKYFGSNRVGFDVVRDFAYTNLNHWNLAADLLMIFGPSSYRLFLIQNEGRQRASKSPMVFHIGRPNIQCLWLVTAYAGIQGPRNRSEFLLGKQGPTDRRFGRNFLRGWRDSRTAESVRIFLMVKPTGQLFWYFHLPNVHHIVLYLEITRQINTEIIDLSSLKNFPKRISMHWKFGRPSFRKLFLHMTHMILACRATCEWYVGLKWAVIGWGKCCHNDASHEPLLHRRYKNWDTGAKTYKFI